ncbi:MAG: VTT domain-containing protein [Clostridiales bacterium]|nr:VTT domain-containing protein [Clostridiales bacterium]
MEKNNLDRKGALNYTTIILYAIALILSAVTFVLDSTDVGAEGWGKFMEELGKVQDYINHLPNKWLILLAVFVVYLLKNFIPVPFPFIFMMVGALYGKDWSVVINVCGYTTLLITKYLWGRKMGGGTAVKKLKKYDNVREMMYKPGPIKLGVLVFARLCPSIPVSIVSKIYGGMKYPIIPFILASIVGFFPKIWTYSRVLGQDVNQPFTWKFMGPIVGLLIISGTAALIANTILNKKEDKKGERSTEENELPEN